MTVQNLASTATLVIVGTFDGYDVPLWNTVDGKRPPAPSIHGSEAIYRPAKIRPERVLRGDSSMASVVARVEGGDLGCDSYVFDSAPTLKPGDEYLFFLGFSVSAAGLYTMDSTVYEAWPVDSKGSVRTAREGSVEIDRIAAVVSDSTAPPLPQQ